MLRKIIVSLCASLALVLGLATPANASGYSVSHYVPGVNYFIVGCNSPQVWFTMYYGEAFVDCAWFSVGDRARIRYLSIWTGAYYWSNCGQYLPSPAGQPWGMQRFGNDIRLVEVARYPNGAAANC